MDDRSNSRARRTRTGLLFVAAALLAVQGCGGGSKPAPHPSASTGSPSAANSPTPQPSATQLPNPLDNVGTAGNTLAVKIDNVGRQTQALQQGLAQADIVYWIQVEGGLSRFLALYDSNHLPGSIGPVRSARETDIPLLQQYGRLDFAYSGAISGLKPLLAQADLTNITPITDPGLYSNGGIGPTFVDPHKLFAKYPSVPARSPGFRFGDAPGGGTPLNDMTWRQPAATIGVHYNGSGYDVAVDGHSSWSGTATVVVQHVSIVPGSFTDYNAGSAANEVFTHTTGSGTAQVLRGGQVWNVTWNRPDPNGGTSYTLPDGSAMPFATGPVLVVLVP
ncbi:DUF3048 domain-containing protein [Kitasatospora viridis]|uniref:DUF3048 family protein n=1 Tax=Kitasatospora viridis TaxID=281105 RepID=A0A561S9F2_9ACTN|nr:DUF3048 domain-containing protein [Kitasatospora viridis]TWF71498.1 DUF3048 family protein [Kitasatospora viridis]